MDSNESPGAIRWGAVSSYSATLGTGAHSQHAQHAPRMLPPPNFFVEDDDDAGIGSDISRSIKSLLRFFSCVCEIIKVPPAFTSVLHAAYSVQCPSL